MKKNKLFLFSLLLIFCTSVCTAQSNEIPTEVFTALNQGNANQLSVHFHENIELAVMDKADVYSKQQATAIITNFFKKNQVSDFQVIHKGTKDSASFAIGLLKTTNGVYRVHLLMRVTGKKNTIQQLRIEQSND